MRSTSKAAVLAAMLAGLLIAGCAQHVAGTASPEAGGVVSVVRSSAESGVTVPETAGTGSDLPPSSTGESSPAGPSGGSSTDLPGSGAATGPGPDSGASGQATAGTYPTAPLQIPATPGTRQQAVLLEARRIAGYLISPAKIDPKLTRPASLSTLPFKGPTALGTLFVDPVPQVAERGGMITGFGSSRSVPEVQSDLVLAALEYPSAAAAAKAVLDLAAAVHDPTQDVKKAAVPGFPAARGWESKSASGRQVQAFLAQGAMVLYVWNEDAVGSKTDLYVRMRQSFAAMAKSFAGFTPVPEADLMKQRTDPYGLIAHTLPNTGDNATVLDGVYTGTGQLHYDSDPVGTSKLFAAAGVDLVSDGRTSLYRAKDAAGAAAVRDNFIASTQQQDASWTAYAVQTDAPDAKCVQQSLNAVYYCMATSGRYAIEVSAGSESDLVAAINAQVHLLNGFA